MKKSSLYLYLQKLKHRFFKSSSYWDRRYRKGRNSGGGSYGRLADFKAEIINGFVADHDVKSVIEFGCGDGNQLKLADYQSYIGIDVSRKAVKLCQEMYREDSTKSFFHTSEYDGQKAELAMSLDVVYHLVEDSVFEKYMKDLFAAATRFVIVYSSDYEQSPEERPSHVRHRKFTDWVATNCPNASMIQKIPNRYPPDHDDSPEVSFADFYIYEIA